METTIIRWINSMLKSRSIVATLSGETLQVSVTRGCPQGVCCHPCCGAWSLMSFWGELNEEDYYAVRYADNIAILINGKFPQRVSQVLQTALGLIQRWCDRTNLCISPSKMVIIPFTKKKALKGLKEPTLFGKTI
jgi:hypothetical protein